MKKLLYTLIMFALFLSSCEAWTEMEQARHTDLTQGNKSEEFYASLREYRKTKHPITFGWFGGWTGSDASMQTSLRGLPDSTDMVSIWGGPFNLTEAKKKDLKFVQEKRGMKVLICFILANIGDQITPAEVKENWEENGFKDQREAIDYYWGRTDDSDEAYDRAIVNYANALCDSIEKYGYDGFDWDMEARGNIAQPQPNHGKITVFLDAMRARLGTQKETGKIIAVDGSPNWMGPENRTKVDYYIFQSYQKMNEQALNNDLKMLFERIGTSEEDYYDIASKTIVTCTFEGKTNGGNFTDRFGNKLSGYEGMARWTPIVNGVEYPKGGIGSYHMEYSYLVSGMEGNYPYLREGIRIMNPVVK